MARKLRTAESVWDRVQVGAPDECWPWLGFTNAATHCPHGHEYTAANSVMLWNGYRACRTCINTQRRARRRRNRPEVDRDPGVAGCPGH